MKNNNSTIIVNRTTLNARAAFLLCQSEVNEEIDCIAEIISKITAEEKKQNRPIMNISLDISEAQQIFSEDFIEQRISLCSIG